MVHLQSWSGLSIKELQAEIKHYYACVSGMYWSYFQFLACVNTERLDYNPIRAEILKLQRMGDIGTVDDYYVFYISA